jgi:hypothetical protein
MSTPLDRLKSQLLTSGIQQENIALFQVINQLIDYLRDTTVAVQAIAGSSSSPGALGATFLTKNKEVLLPNSYQELAGSGIEFNDSKNRRIISTALPVMMGSDEEVLEGREGTPGQTGPRGFTGKDGVPGIAGEDGIDGIDSLIPGPVGSRGLTGLSGISGIDGIDGVDGFDSFIPGPAGPAGISGTIGRDGITIPGIDGLDGEQGEPGIPGPPGIVGGNSGVKFWFDITDASDIAGYKKALRTPSPNAEATNVQVCAGVGDNLLYSFVTEPGVPGVYQIQPGAGFRHIHSAVTTVGGFARYKVELYYCNANGTGETLVGSSYSDSITDTSIDEVDWDLYQITAVPILPTQRLVWKLYVARVSGPANVSVTTYFEGLVHPSYVESTISGGAVGPPGPMGIPGLGIPGMDGIDGEPEMSMLSGGNFQEQPTSASISTTGVINDLDFGNVSQLRMTNATLATITGLKAGRSGQRLTIIAAGAGQVDISNETVATSVAANRILSDITNGVRSLAPGYGTISLEYDLISARWRMLSHEQGAWILVPFAAGHFTGGGGMAWTLAAGDYHSVRYWLRGRVLNLEFAVVTTSVGGGNSALIWALFTATGFVITNLTSIYTLLYAVDNGTTKAVKSNHDANSIYFYPFTGNWAAAVNTTDISFTGSYEVV